MEDLLKSLDSLSGIAAVINGALLWPIVRSLKRVTHDHGTRLTAVERLVRRPKSKRRKRQGH